MYYSVSKLSEFVPSLFPNRVSSIIRSWPTSSLHHVLIAFSLLINAVAGRHLYPNAHDALRDNLSTDVNAINMYTNNLASPKLCSFRLDTDSAQLSLNGRITVITKFNTDLYVMRQVIMFNKLESRFRNGGFLNTQFVVVYTENGEASATSSPIETTTTTASETNTTSENLQFARTDPIERIPTVYNVTVLKENLLEADNPIRSPFEGFETHACYVFDTCGRLAYIIYYPWSNIQRPFVKASILSTNFDHPCGKCENASSSSTTSTEVTTSILSESSTLHPPTTVSQPEQSIDPVSRIHLTGPASTTSATKRRANLIRIDLKRAEDTINDDSYKIPLQFVVPAEHAHLEVHPESDPANETNTTEEFYIKFKFMVLRSGDPDFHGHLPNDQPERLTKLPSSNNSLLATADLDLQIANISTPEIGTIPEAMIVYSNVFEDLFLGLAIALSSNDSLQPSPILSTYSPNLQRIHFTKEFVNLQSLHEYKADRSNLFQDTANLEQLSSLDDRNVDGGENAVYQLSEDQRQSNEHYSQILQWIQFVL